MSAEIIGPFQEHRLVVDGYRVPLVEAVEIDGGKVTFVLDKRFGFTVDAGQFEDAAWFIAQCIAVGFGASCHSREDMDTPEQIAQRWGHVHAALRPTRLIGIESVATEQAEPEASS